ncbi:MAG TPA: hypothetical protein PK800_04060 [Syntrophorhabdaceae bacterium]|mgnify:FL=1|nr:hypothetical protein [Syntrophorhabdaceae bacterium]
MKTQNTENKKRNEKKIDTPETRAKLLTVLTMHVGETNAIPMSELYERVFEEKWHNKINDTRKVRLLINRMRSEGVAICSTTDQEHGGYYLASAGSEVNDYLRRLERRALKILWRISKIKKVSLPELLGQMRLRMVEKEVKEAPDAA